MKKNKIFWIALLPMLLLLVGCQRQSPTAVPSPIPSAAAPSPPPSIEPALLDDGLGDALEELEVVE